jgi:hypothetical protein
MPCNPAEEYPSMLHRSPTVTDMSTPPPAEPPSRHRHHRRSHRYSAMPSERSAVSVAKFIGFSIFGGAVLGALLWVASDVQDSEDLARSASLSNQLAAAGLMPSAPPEDPHPAAAESPVTRSVSAGPIGTSASARDVAETPIPADERAVRHVLSRYRAAYSELDPYAARQIYPDLDVIALTRAFDQLSAQELDFDSCSTELSDGQARADCVGWIWSAPKSSDSPRSLARRWRFRLAKSAEDWLIVSVEVVPIVP